MKVWYAVYVLAVGWYFLLLTWLGRCPAEEPFNLAARVARVAYFSFFFVLAAWRNLAWLKAWVGV